MPGRRRRAAAEKVSARVIVDLLAIVDVFFIDAFISEWILFERWKLKLL